MSEDARYILAKKIARGGMAEIYLGKHVGEDGFQRLCAIKRILPHYAQDQEFIQMFRDEAHICKRLQHANIVRVEGFEEVEGSYAIIMEFVDGADLRTLLHAVEQTKKRMPLPMACYIIAEAARGLHYAHTKVDEITQQPLGIVHRDISPQNILVSYEGEIKVTDFGIADAESKLTETRPGIVKGKYSYMSPEQISAKTVDARTDVFALSIVLWEMLTMRRLFQGENEVDTIQRVKNCKIDVEMRSLNAEIDEELEAIVKKGLAKDPRRRYKNAADFEKDLRRYMSKKHPEFTPEDLGNFLKTNMESKRNESAADIKKTLTETSQKPQNKSKTSGRRRAVDLALDENNKNGPVLSVARPSGRVGLGPGSSSSITKTPSPTAPLSARTSTSWGKGSQTRNTAGHPMHGSARRSQPPTRFVFSALVAALLLFVGYKVATSLPAKPAQLTIRTLPSRVRITVDDKELNQGRYVRASSSSPLKLTLKPGPHKLVISRPGYYSYHYELTLEDGERQTKDDIVLRERAPLASVKIKMKPADKPVKFDIESGYFVGALIPDKVTAVAPDLLQGHSYKMRVQLEEGAAFVCRFTPKSASWRQPTEVTIDRIKRRCTISGP